jgi:hypothetical protein
MSARFKYQTTHHFEWSPGVSNDDEVLKSSAHFVGKRVIATKKMDGENTSIYWDSYMHARSIDGHGHESQDWVKGQVVPYVAPHLPEGWRICGENLYAKHSLAYDNLPTYFMVFSIWDAENRALSWDDTKEWCELLGLQTVPVLYDGIWDEKIIRQLATQLDLNTDEGYVVRVADSFSFQDFVMSLAKYVRKGHVQTDRHWKRTWVPNKLINS